MTKRFILNAFITICYFLFSCNSHKSFNSIEWNSEGVDWQMTDVREQVVKDIINSDTLIGLAKEKVIELLGELERADRLINCSF